MVIIYKRKDRQRESERKKERDIKREREREKTSLQSGAVTQSEEKKVTTSLSLQLKSTAPNVCVYQTRIRPRVPLKNNLLD